MRNTFDLKYETLLELLGNLGLNSEQIEAAETYLENGEEELLKDLPEIDFSKINNKERQELSKIYQKLKSKTKEKEYARCFHLLFTMGTCTLSSLLPIYEFGYNDVNKNSYTDALKRDELITMYVELRGNFYVYTSFIDSIISLMKSSKENIEDLFEKIEEHHKKHCKCRTMLPLYCAYFKIKEEDTSIEEISSNKKIAGFLKSYEDCIVTAINNLSASKSKGNEKTDLEALKEFIKTGHEDSSLSSSVSFLTNKYSAMNENSFLFPLGCAFLNKNISSVLYNFVNVCLNINIDISLNILDRFAYLTTRYIPNQKQRERYSDTFIKMLHNFSIDISKALKWYARNYTKPDYERNDTLEYCAKEYNEIYVLSLKDTKAREYSIMLSALRQVNKEQAEEILESDKERLKKEYIGDIITCNQAPFYSDICQFIYGQKDISVLYQYEKELYQHGISFYGTIIQAFKGYIEIFGIDDNMKRILTYYCFIGSGNISSSYTLNNIVTTVCKRGYSNSELDEKKVMLFFESVDSMGLPILCQLSVMGSCYDAGYYSDNRLACFVAVIGNYLEIKKEETLQAIRETSASGRMMGILALGTSPKEYKQELLDSFSDTSKAVKSSLVDIIVKQESFREDIIEKLHSKKATEREVAVRILSKWKKEEDKKALELALEKEKSSKVSALISEALDIKMEVKEEEKEGGATIHDFVKNITKGNRKKTLAWAFETPFSTIHTKEGKEVEEDYIMALLLCYSTMNIPGINEDAPRLAEALNPQELAHFMKELFEKWVENGAEAKKKWVLYASSIHGGAEIVADLQHYINEWPKISRGAIAAEAVKALALNNSSSALLVVDSISRKFKFRQVKNAAGEALDFAAKQLGITKEELADKIVPDLGFNENMERIFDYGERQFKVYINQALEIEVYDGNNKKLKNLPSPGKKDDEVKAAQSYAEFKLMKKQMKTVVSTQKMRLELALSSERKWKSEDWKHLFIKNPIMHQFAISLIWGIYKEGNLTDTFRYMEDGSFNTAEEEEYELTEDCLIGLVHPIELTEEQKSAWKEQLEDYEITQSIEQLDRKVYELKEEEKKEKYLERFGGKVVNDLSLIGKLSGMGWYRGSVLDAGGFCEYYREDAALGLGVELHFSGTYVGGENEDITVYHAIFYKTRYENDKDGNGNWAVERGSYIYDEIKEEAVVPLKDVPKRYFSEIVYQLEKATSSSTETEENWRTHAYPKGK